MGMEGNFEQPKEVLAPHERGQVFTNPTQILEQMETSQARYEQALEKLRAGNKDDLDYLEEMQQNLVAFKNKLDIEFGTHTPATADIARQVTGRLFELSEELEKITH